LEGVPVPEMNAWVEVAEEIVEVAVEVELELAAVVVW
jgi:hypothetical protein